MQTNKNLVNFWWFQSVYLDKNLKFKNYLPWFPSLKLHNQLLWRNNQLSWESCLAVAPFCLICFDQAESVPSNVWFCLQLRWFLVCKLSQTFIGTNIAKLFRFFSHFMGPTRPLRNTCPSGSFQNPCQTQGSKSCFSLWSQDIEFRLHLYS